MLRFWNFDMAELPCLRFLPISIGHQIPQLVSCFPFEIQIWAHLRTTVDHKKSFHGYYTILANHLCNTLQKTIKTVPYGWIVGIYFSLPSNDSQWRHCQPRTLTWTTVCCYSSWYQSQVRHTPTAFMLSLLVQQSVPRPSTTKPSRFNCLLLQQLVPKPSTTYTYRINCFHADSLSLLLQQLVPKPSTTNTYRINSFQADSLSLSAKAQTPDRKHRDDTVGCLMLLGSGTVNNHIDNHIGQL